MMEGLIYKTQPYQENSRLLFVYTPKGKVTLFARGAQKVTDRNRIIGQYLTHISFKENPNKTFYTLQDAQLINDYQLLKTSFQKTQRAALILELIDRLIVDQMNDDIVYQLMIDALADERITQSSLSFAIKLLKLLGYGIDLNPQEKQIKGINIQKGGLIYPQENASIDLSAKDAVTLLKLYAIPYSEQETFDDEILNRIIFFIDQYYQYHLNIQLKNIKITE